MPDPRHAHRTAIAFQPDVGEARIGVATRMECAVCWQVYDPACGDASAQIPPGTSFANLPAHWRCPNCDGGRDRYIVVSHD